MKIRKLRKLNRRNRILYKINVAIIVICAMLIYGYVGSCEIDVIPVDEFTRYSLQTGAIAIAFGLLNCYLNLCFDRREDAIWHRKRVIKKRKAFYA